MGFRTVTAAVAFAAICAAPACLASPDSGTKAASNADTAFTASVDSPARSPP